ncbi:MAG: sigma-54-dependent Fis family transcriptional regulator [Deltaproteobacteria bacterium]|nr:sigma-54-dependent Fis family transcriptional regulator [Deltaproteobacteria bacterium]
MNRSATKERILAVDDSPDTLEVLRRNLASHGYQVLIAPGVAEAVRILEEGPVDVVVTDLKMPGASGLDLIRHVRDNFKSTEVLMITGYPSVEGAVEAVKTGADDYLSKPFTDEELLTAVKGAFEKLRARNAMQAPPDAPAYPTPALIGECEAMRYTLHAVGKATHSKAPVLITGEQGTGKELIARSIHYSSPRASAPFVLVSCSVIPGDRVESELFGSSSPAPSRTGLVHAAQGGTLFFEEIAAAIPAVQTSLVRLIRDKAMPEDAPPLPHADARVIASSARDLKSLVSRGLFREDLYYALNVIEVRVPPLRERGDDVLMLARHYALKFSAEQGRPEPRFSDRSLRVLKNHSWPGNLQELENTIQRLVVMTDAGVIDVPDLPSLMRFSALRDRGLDRSLAEIEAEHIRNVMGSVQGNQTRAAEILGIDRKTLREKMKRINKANEG